LMPSVEESVMVTPEVVGHIDPVCRSPAVTLAAAPRPALLHS
jgi:hypothetical protein